MGGGGKNGRGERERESGGGEVLVKKGELEEMGAVLRRLSNIHAVRGHTPFL